MQRWPITVPIMLKNSRMMEIKVWLVSILTSQGIWNGLENQAFGS